MIRTAISSFLLLGLSASCALAGPYAPAAGQPGSEAIAKDDSAIVGWADGVVQFLPGPIDVSDPGSELANFGTPAAALGPAEGMALEVVSLGDGGSITLSFAPPIADGPGFDLAVFENGITDTFLELAVVEVSSNGVDFVRFPAVSRTPTDAQVAGFGTLDPTDLDNLAGKYRQGYGTPLDLAELTGASPAVDVNNIGFVRLIDVVGNIAPAYATLDSLGNPINDPWPTPFTSGGFDLDAVAVLHEAPEPSCAWMLSIVAIALATMRRR